MNKKDLIFRMNVFGFYINDVAVIDGKEMVEKRVRRDKTMWVPLENEGESFERIFKGEIKKAVGDPEKGRFEAFKEDVKGALNEPEKGDADECSVPSP